MDTGSIQDAITGVATQGRAHNDRWVSSFKVSVSDDASNWTPVDGGVTFPGLGTSCQLAVFAFGKAEFITGHLEF
jgi:hypothetical protein